MMKATTNNVLDGGKEFTEAPVAVVLPDQPMIIFTLCSVNYLAHAKTLGESLREHNPNCHFVIGLVDRIPRDFDLEYWHPFELIPVADLNIPHFQEMQDRYNLVELNTAVKPFYMEYLYQRDTGVDMVIYLDPDILVLSGLNPLIETLRTHSLVLTPHSCTFKETKDHVFYEYAMLNTGIYNLGFLGSSRSSETISFLRWWQARLRDMCYYRPGQGLFVDQLWAILAPLYCPSAYVETNPGYNMCYWNLFERSLTQVNGHYLVNGKHPLLFYHFSSFNPDHNDKIANREGPPLPTLAERPDIKPLIEEYRARLHRNKYRTLRNIPCFYSNNSTRRNEMGPSKRAKAFVQGTLRIGIGVMPKAVRSKLARLANFVGATCSN